MDLLYLLIAERIVLLHSPSGAGKTSLIEAKLVPKLLKRRFEVLPTMRVSIGPSSDIELPPEINRYVLSLLLCLEGEAEGEEQAAQKMGPEELRQLAAMTLADYLARRLEDSDAEKVLLIFDQFEEILTADPTDLNAKQEFFAQTADALRDPRYWALFAMREDHVAALDPYLRPLPISLSTTYRLELLGRESACDAVQKPARKVGVEFADDAAQTLVDDLRQVRIQRLDGSMQKRLGPYVEPAQLQVVCRLLWPRPRPNQVEITEADVKSFGTVEKALGTYYAGEVARVADETDVPERMIRDWFDGQLITEQGFRGQVMQGVDQSEGLKNDAIRRLIDAYLVRQERRRGITWFELAHDRLIEPVRRSNANWFTALHGLSTSIAIRIFPKDRPTGNYPVQAILDDGSFFPNGELRLDLDALQEAELDLGSEAYGTELFHMLFSGPIRRAYDKVTRRAEAETEGRVRVHLWIDDGARELHALPWERLYCLRRGQAVPLSTSTLTPFSRYTGLALSEPEPIVERPIRLLFALSNPRGLPRGLAPINVEQEVQNLRQALGDLRRTGQVQVTLLPGRSGLPPELRVQLEADGYQIQDGATTLENILRLLPGFHVFHFLAHGHFHRLNLQGEGRAALYLEKADGTWVAVKDEELVLDLSSTHPLPHLVFLALCQSAKRDPDVESPYVCLGPKLVKAGVPAVVAMQDVIPVDLAQQLTGDFYRRLLEHGLVDLALNEARNLLFRPDRVEWAIPVLFNRLATGRLVATVPAFRVSAPFQAARVPLHRVPFQAPSLPPHYVPRSEVGKVLRESLLSNSAAPGVSSVSAIHGMGGSGKTVVAVALAHDMAVRARFADGVLWATLGQEPDLLGMLSGWIQALGDYGYQPSTVEAASNHLRSFLWDRACLLVVDDAWDPQHVQPFLVGGPRCHTLVTTRDAIVAKVAGAALYELGVMTLNQALDLLSNHLRRGLEGRGKEKAAELAREVGHLPLALELAATQIAEGVSWDELLAALRDERDRFEALQALAPEEVTDEVLRKGRSPRGSLNLSLQRLPETRRRDFAWLGVLPKDVALTPAMATTLWDTSVKTARRTLRYLQRNALLLAGPSGLDHTPTYRIHNLLHSMARRLLIATPPDGLGLSLPATHATLLVRYRARTRDGLWHTLPADGYIHAHLTWHMEQVGWIDEIHALLREETNQGRNGWYQASGPPDQADAYLADVNRAWRLAEEEFTERRAASALALQCRYALIVTSINSLAKNVPPALLSAMVENGIWTPLKGLLYARQAPNPPQRAAALVGLVPHLPVVLLPEALAAARAIKDVRYRAEALTGLVPHLPQSVSETVLTEALAAARAIEHEWYRTQALAGLAPHLPELARGQVLTEGLAAARVIEDEWYRTQALAGLTPHLPELAQTQVLAEGLVAARVIKDERYRAEALAGLAPYLPEPLWAQVLEEAWAAARRIWDEGDRAWALARLVPHLPELAQRQALEEAWVAARVIKDERYRAWALAGLAPYLPELARGQVLAEGLAAARAIEGGRHRAEVLAGLAPHLPESERVTVLVEALAAVQAIGDEDFRAEALAGLASYLPEPERVSVLKETPVTARAIESERRRLEMSAQLVSHLPESEQRQVLVEALVAARAMENRESRSKALVGLAQRLAALSDPDLALLWLEERDGLNLLHFLARCQRQDLLTDLRALAPVISALGGAEAVVETFRAIQDVGRWWP